MTIFKNLFCILSLFLTINSYASCLCIYKYCACLSKYKPPYSYLGDNTAFLELQDKTSIFVDTRDNFIAMDLIQHGKWEDKDIRLVTSFLKPNSRVIDVGSNYGTYTMRIAKHLKEIQHKKLNKNQVYAFEANPRIFSLLSRSISYNKLDVNLFNSAVYSKSNKDVSFAVDAMNAGAGRVTNSGLTNSGSDKSLSRVFNLKTVALDDVLEGHNMKFDLIRMDAEGCELEILKGAQNILKNSPEIIVYAEWYPHMMKDHSNFEEELDNYIKSGFNFYKVISGKLSNVSKDELLDPEDKFQNIVFTRKKLLS